MILDRACHSCRRVTSLFRPTFFSSSAPACNINNDLIGVVREEAVKQDRRAANLPNHLSKTLGCYSIFFGNNSNLSFIEWERFPANKVNLVPHFTGG